MRDKNFSRQAKFSALFFTFAGMLLSQTPGTTQESGAAAPVLMASTAFPSMGHYPVLDSAPEDVTVKPTARSSSVPAPTKPALAAAGTRIDHTLVAPKFNTMASVQDQATKHSSFGVEPGALPLYVRLHPISATEMYGAAPAVVRLRFGQK